MRILFVKSKDNIDVSYGKVRETLYLKIEADDDLEVREDFGMGIDWTIITAVNQKKIQK